MRLLLIFVAVALMASRCDRNSDTDSDWNIGDPEISVKTEPLFPEREENDLVTIWFSAEGSDEPLSLESIEIRFTDNSAVASLAAISAWYTGVVPGVPQRTLLATLQDPGKKSTFKGDIGLGSGKNYFVLSFDARNDADLAGSLGVESVTLSFCNNASREITPSPGTPVIRFGKILRAAGQDGVDTYRIPGLVTTNSGTLIAVYDNRYNNSKDLQEDIDIGMSRSTDGGETWYIGIGAKTNTTEAQVAELSDGSLMLNMRDDRNRTDKTETNGRAVAVTSDIGATWTVHPSSNSLLPEPNCMASLIAADVNIDGKMKRVLFFSNPDDKRERTNMTVKASLDEGVTWPEEQQVELFAPAGYGYSCLTMVDDSHIGILYEGVKELYFQKIKVDELLGNN
jgi:hypothetical protein